MIKLTLMHIKLLYYLIESFKLSPTVLFQAIQSFLKLANFILLPISNKTRCKFKPKCKPPLKDYYGGKYFLYLPSVRTN